MKPLIGIVARVEYPGGTHKLVINDEYRYDLKKFDYSILKRLVMFCSLMNIEEDLYQKGQM